MSSKWLDLLKQIDPRFTRATFMFNPDTAPYINSFFMPSFAAAAKTLKVAASVAPVHGDAEIEAAIALLTGEPRGVLLVGPDNFMDIHRRLIISLAARYNVPAIYLSPESARTGGLLSYGADFRDIFHRAARYVDRILRGTKPSELPVQMPVKYLMIVNLQTAKALGIVVPPAISAKRRRGDRVGSATSGTVISRHRPAQSITSSASRWRRKGTMSPRAFAVYVLSCSSNLVGCWTI